MVQPQKVKERVQPPFYHRKLAKSGGSRYLAVGGILPKDWLIVKIVPTRLSDTVFTLEITKLA